MGSKKQKVQRREAKERKSAANPADLIDYDAIVTGKGGKSYTTLNKMLKLVGSKGGPFRSFYNGTMPAEIAERMRAALERAGKPLTSGSPQRASIEGEGEEARLRAAPREPDPALLRKPTWMRQGVRVRVVATGPRKGKVGTVEGDLADGYINVDFGKHSLNRFAFYPGELARAEGDDGK